jgi:hypothetical protein
MNIKGTIEGKFKFIAVDENGNERYPIGDKWYNNLVLNSGLDMILNGTSPANATTDEGFTSVMAYCRLSEFETGSVSATDQFMNLQGASSGTYTKSNPSGTDTINQVTYSTDSNYYIAEFQRTFVLAPTGVGKNWNGIGISNSPNAADRLFSKIILGGTLTVLGTEELRVVYKLTLRIPKNAVSVSVSSGTFNGEGDLKVVGGYSTIFGGINSNGTPSGGLAGSVPQILRGKGAVAGYLLTNSAFPADNTSLIPTYSGSNANDSLSTSSSLGAYTNGTFQRDITINWGAGRPSLSVSNIRSLIICPVNGATAGLQYLLDNAQSKGDANLLSTTYRVAWTRV